MLGLLALAGELAGLGRIYGYMLIPVALHLAWLVLLWSPDNPGDCLRRFKASRWTGLLIVLAIVAGRLIA